MSKIRTIVKESSGIEDEDKDEQEDEDEDEKDKENQEISYSIEQVPHFSLEPMLQRA